MDRILKHTRRPDISFCRNGRILLSARIVRELALRPGDSINIARRDDEYLLFALQHDASLGRSIAVCFPSKKGGNHFCAYSKTLCNAILSLTGSADYKVSLMTGQPITIDGKIHIPIITRQPL